MHSATNTKGHSAIQTNHAMPILSRTQKRSGKKKAVESNPQYLHFSKINISSFTNDLIARMTIADCLISIINPRRFPAAIQSVHYEHRSKQHQHRHQRNLSIQCIDCSIDHRTISTKERLRLKTLSAHRSHKSHQSITIDIIISRSPLAVIPSVGIIRHHTFVLIPVLLAKIGAECDRIYIRRITTSGSSFHRIHLSVPITISRIVSQNPMTTADSITCALAVLGIASLARSL